MTTPSTRAVIDLEAVAGNVRALRSITNPSARFMAVVKADAYGHGCIQVAETALASGADCLGVARIEEGRRLRSGGITAPVLVFGHIPGNDLPDLVEYDLAATAFSVPSARAISRVAHGLGKTIRIHVKIDTGMGRLGLFPEASRASAETGSRTAELTSHILSISNLPGLFLEGIYTHFSTGDVPGCRFAAAQLESFLELLSSVRNAGLDIPVRHAANSGALLHMPDSHLDMVRPGIALYGLYPSRMTDRNRITLRPAMSLITRVAHLKKVPAGFPVSYGRTHETTVPTVIATVPVGYADGYARALSNRGQMLVRGQKAPVIGRVCMDLTLIDVGHIPGVALDDEVVVFGRQGDREISADDLADTLDTINYEIVTSVSTRVPREYDRGQGTEVGGQPRRRELKYPV